MDVLIVEDEALVALDLSEMVESMGHTVIGPCISAAAALAAIDVCGVDFAVLDFNLRTGTSTPVADVLVSRSVRFVFLTGYRRDALPARFCEYPLLSKPVNVAVLERTLSGVGRPL